LAEVSQDVGMEQDVATLIICQYKTEPFNGIEPLNLSPNPTRVIIHVCHGLVFLFHILQRMSDLFRMRRGGFKAEK